MANNIELIKKYAAQNLDELFIKSAVTGILEGNNGILNFITADTALIPDTTMDGLGDYARAGHGEDIAFPEGNVNVKWTPYTLKMDRAKQFVVDNMDNEETAGIAFGNRANEFMRYHVIPEVDACRLSTLFGLAPAANIVTETIAENSIIKKFNAVIKSFEDDEVNTDEMFCFISTDINRMLKDTTELQKKITQADYKVGDFTFKVNAYEGIPLIPVPLKRFKTSYIFETGRGETKKFGFTPDATAKDINFMFVHKRSAIPVKKHAPVRVFTPEEYQKADAYLFQYRLYHDIFTPKNKTAGIRASVKA